MFVFFLPSYPNAEGYDCVNSDGGGFRAIESSSIYNTASIEPRVINLGSISFGGSASCASGVLRFIELGDLLESTSRVDEMLDRLEFLEQKVESLEQSLESCQCASDLDGDGAVGFNDLVQLISNWGPRSA